jgi:hypothetical protein
MFDPFDPGAAKSADDLEDFIVFAIFVAGKPAARTRQVVNDFYAGRMAGESPLRYARRLVDSGRLEATLRDARSGQYSRITRALDVLSGRLLAGEINLRECSVDDLESVPGIGMKTSRFFLTYSRKDVRHAVLDRHVLKWLGARGVEAPSSTPTSRRKYAELERKFLEICDNMGIKPKELDFEVWNTSARKPGGTRCPAQP